MQRSVMLCYSTAHLCNTAQLLRGAARRDLIVRSLSRSIPSNRHQGPQRLRHGHRPKAEATSCHIHRSYPQHAILGGIRPQCDMKSCGSSTARCTTNSCTLPHFVSIAVEIKAARAAVVYDPANEFFTASRRRRQLEGKRSG